MYDVHHRMVELVLQAYEQETGLSAEHLLASVGCVRGEEMKWNPFVKLLETCADQMSEERMVELFSAETLTHPLLEATRNALLTFGSPETYFKMMNQVTGPRMFPCIQAKWLHHSRGKLIFELVLVDENHLPCSLFFKTTKKTFEGSYGLLGVQDGTVRMTETIPGRCALFEMHSSAKPTVFSWLKDRANSLVANRLVAVFEEQQREIFDKYEELSRLHHQLESQVERRTYELEALNREYEAQSQAKSRYLAEMTHEIRTPMHSIILGVGLIRDSVESEDYKTIPHDISMIESASHHLLQLVEDVLDMSKIEAGRLHLEPTFIDVHELLNTVARSLQSLIDDSDNTLTLELQATPSPLWLDGRRLQQIVVNLLGNAAKFTRHGTITLRTRETSTSWVMEVQDTGEGMSFEALQRLFEPFERLDRDRHISGTGLGLPISRELARLMGGDLVASSSPGEGALFSLELPLSEVNPDPKRQMDS